MTKPTIVVIDDQNYVNMSIELALSDVFSIRSFTDIPSLLVYITNKPVVSGFIIDYHIGIESGLDLMKDKIKPLYPSIASILISAFYYDNIPTVDQSDIRRYFDISLTKPFEIRDLKQKALSLFKLQNA